MSIVITSGSIRGVEDIEQAVDSAVLDGTQAGVLTALQEFIPTIAKKSGSMRRSFNKAVKKLLFEFQEDDNKWVLSWEAIKALTELFLSKNMPDYSKGGEPYSKYHFRGRGFYVSPSTFGTFPMRLSRFKPKVIRAVVRNINLNLKARGLENHAVYSVG